MKEYFSHDFGARNDPKLAAVLMELGHEGKSVYWDLVEMLYEQGGYLMRSQCKSYAFALRTDCDLIFRLVDGFDLFATDGERFWSETALRRLGQRNAKSEKAKQSATKRWAASERNANALPTQCEGNAIKEKKRKVNTSDDVAPPPVPEAEKVDKMGKTPPAPLLPHPAALLTDPDDEQHWSLSPLSKPRPFRVICERNGFADIDFEHYRRQALAAAEDANISRTVGQWNSWCRKFLNNQSQHGPLLRAAAVDLSRPTPRESLPPPGTDCTGLTIVLPNRWNDTHNRMAATAQAKQYPNATFVHTR